MKTKISKNKTVCLAIKDLATKDELKKFEKSIELIKKYPVKKTVVKEVIPVWQICT